MTLADITFADMQRYAGIFAFAVMPFLVVLSNKAVNRARAWNAEAKASPETWDDRPASAFLGTAVKFERLCGRVSRFIALLLPLGQAAREALTKVEELRAEKPGDES